MSYYYIWNLAKLQYRSKIPDIDIWMILNTKPLILKVSDLALISGMICNSGFQVDI
jgi:hypothetical protein